MQLKLLTWNIWHGKYLDKVLEFIKNCNADIVALQEVAEMGITNQAAYLADNGGYKYKVYYRSVAGPKHKIGNAIMSKYQLQENSVYFLSDPKLYDGNAETEPRIAVRARITINDKTLDIFATHLAYSHEFADSKFRDIQTENLIKLLPQEKTILMGDFNSLPQSKYIQQFSSILYNTDMQSEKPTWSVFPTNYKGFVVNGLEYRIDYIFTSKDITPNTFSVEQTDASDHLPVSAVIEI